MLQLRWGGASPGRSARCQKIPHISTERCCTRCQTRASPAGSGDAKLLRVIAGAEPINRPIRYVSIAQCNIGCSALKHANSYLTISATDNDMCRHSTIQIQPSIAWTTTLQGSRCRSACAPCSGGCSRAASLQCAVACSCGSWWHRRGLSLVRARPGGGRRQPRPRPCWA
jgi:hypothetical protein